MSSLSDVLAPVSHLSLMFQAPALPLAVVFTIGLVAWLVAVEESELRRGSRPADGSSG